MIVHLSRESGVITLLARAEGDGAIGDLHREIRPGESALGRTYEEWSALPDGPHPID